MSASSLEQFILGFIVPVVILFGVSGNVINLFVLTAPGMKTSLQPAEIARELRDFGAIKTDEVAVLDRQMRWKARAQGNRGQGSASRHRLHRVDHAIEFGDLICHARIRGRAPDHGRGSADGVEQFVEEAVGIRNR